MKSQPIPVRFQSDEVQALRKLAASETRTVSGLVRHAVLRELREHGLWPAPVAPTPQAVERGTPA